MCGIVGFVGFSGTSGRAPARILRAMTDALVHRGPDGEGQWLDPEAEIALGHRRLAIVDLSPAGAQPMHSVSGRHVVIFNGEVYNHRALRRQLDAEGQGDWRGHSDTETLLAGFDRWGIEETLRRCIGMFAIAVWDRSQRRLTLIRDRMGEKPLYYGWQGSGSARVFLFGSEIKALRVHPAYDPGIDRVALAQYLDRMVVPGTRSIHEGMCKVPPGGMVTLTARHDEHTVSRYWSVEDAVTRADADRFDGTPDEAVAALESLLGDAVAQQMIADVPLGAFLSGGVDSSTIVALMQAQSERPVRTFSIGFNEAAFDEAPHAKAVARHLGTEHTELYVDGDQARDLIPRLPVIYDEPFADSSALPTLLVSQMARQHVTVSLSGDGGDELFCGYRRYTDARAYWHRMQCIPVPFCRAAARAIRAIPPTVLNRVGAMAGRARLGDKLHKGAALLHSTDQDDLYRRLLSAWPGEGPVIGVLEDAGAPIRGTGGGGDPLDRFMATDMVSYLPDDILTKVDRAAMAMSLETRVPLLDHRVVEFALRLPLSLKLRQDAGRTSAKWILRQVLYRHVPASIIDRPKKGFSVPLAAWLRGELRDWAEDLLDETKLRQQGFLDPRQVRCLWAQHLSGQRNWQNPLWAVLMFQAWLAEWQLNRASHD